MRYEHPLTPPLSPAAGEREKIHVPQFDSLNGERFQGCVKVSLSPSDGERVRVRGRCE